MKGIYRVRDQNPDKSNNFFKQNVINEKLNKIINYKKLFYMTLGGSL